LSQLHTFCGEDRPCSVSRELSKKFEETIRGTLSEVLAHFSQHEPRGEFVLVLGGKKE
jgi:16S rRNA (cytidine1402-2'-O)-methyltransferase